jgi:ATP-binding cassette subfamily C exporter for protease/lipase
LGKIRLDSADIYQWNRLELGKHVGYLPQDIELFGGTVAENIARFGQIDSERVIRAAKLVGLHEVILRLPNGYDTVISDGVLAFQEVNANVLALPEQSMVIHNSSF